MTEGLRLPPTIAACLFDMDGVLTRSAELHAAAWKQTFDDVLAHGLITHESAWVPFDPVADYDAYVDGKVRADGVRSFLASRHIQLAEGSSADLPGSYTVYSVGRRKNQLVRDLISEKGVAAYEGSVHFLSVVRAAGLRSAVVTSSENASAVLRVAGLGHDFEVQVDGEVARQLGLAGKPAPDTFLEAARRLGVGPERSAVFEDALAGVAAGRAGAFGLVVGVDRAGQADALRLAGADVVVTDLAELISTP